MLLSINEQPSTPYPLAADQTRIADMAHHLAYQSAVRGMMCFCRMAADINRGYAESHWQIAPLSAQLNDETKAELESCIHYLQITGHLEPVAGQPGWVKILPEQDK